MVIDAQFLISTECMAVTSAMRRSSRWMNAGIAAILGAPSDTSVSSEVADSVINETDHEHLAAQGQQMYSELNKDSSNEANSGAGVQSDAGSSGSKYGAAKLDSQIISPEISLILEFSPIRSVVLNKEPGKYSVLAVLKPFLAVVKSPLVSGYITALALNSLERFLSLEILTPKSLDIEKGVDEMAYALTHCRFEATDRQEDDAVLLQLMALLDKLVASQCGQLLSTKAMTDIVETCLSMAKQMKRRDALRRGVVAALMSLAHTLFDRRSSSSGSENRLQESRIKFLSAMINVLDPAQTSSSNTLKTTVLNVIKLCFEVSGKEISDCKSQCGNVDRLWKYLAQLIRVTSSPKIVHDALLVVTTIINSNPASYKQQIEFILVYLLTSLTPLSDLPRDESTNDMFYAGVPNRAKSVKSAPIEPGSNTLSIPTAALQKSPEIREVMVEALAAMVVASPTFFSDLFVSYDCDKASPDLCEDILGFLCRNAYPDSATWSTPSVPPLCLEAVLSGLSAWTEVIGSKTLPDHLKKRLENRKGKSIESSVAELFNKSPSKGIAEMTSKNLVKKDDPKDLARFFHTCRMLNKAVLGKFFAKSENKEVLEYYVKAFDFRNKRIDEALRVLLCSFRLPGESQQIENLLQKFADHYIDSGDKVEKTSDSAFILAYAVLMLNTDHFSPTVKRRMNFEAFKKNVQGVNKELPNDYVEAIYNGITSQEIIMPEEHDTDETFEHTWRENVLAQQPAELYFSGTSQSEVVAAIFENSWRPIVSTLSFVFATATDDLVFRRVIAGFHQLAVLASKFHSQQALTHIVACLSQISALSSGDLSFPNSNIEIRIENQTSVIVSDLSTQFGGDLKAQMASITLFRILGISSKELNHYAYAFVCKALTNLHLYGLGTPKLTNNLRPLPPFHTFERSKAGRPVGIFSALSTYLTSSSDTPPEPSDENVDAALGATDCVKACKIDETLRVLFANSPEQFARGALGVVPKDNHEKYQPAKRYLLTLAGHAAQQNPALRQEISNSALGAGLISTALHISPKESAQDIMDKIKVLDSDALSAILEQSPSQSVWRLLSLLPNPDKKVCHYIERNASDVDSESITGILEIIKKSHDESANLNALYALAQGARSSYIGDYSKVLGDLASLCGSKDTEIRETTLSNLQRELLHESQKLSWDITANEILIPNVLEVLLKPEIWKRDPKGMDFTRQQAASVVGKVFLHLTVSLNNEETQSNNEAWIGVLRCLDRLINSRRQPALHDCVAEMLKNVIMVMGLASQGTQEFWDSMQSELKGSLPEVASLISAQLKSENKPGSQGESTSVPSTPGSSESANVKQDTRGEGTTDEEAGNEVTRHDEAKKEDHDNKQSDGKQKIDESNAHVSRNF